MSPVLLVLMFAESEEPVESGLTESLQNMIDRLTLYRYYYVVWSLNVCRSK